MALIRGRHSIGGGTQTSKYGTHGWAYIWNGLSVSKYGGLVLGGGGGDIKSEVYDTGTCPIHKTSNIDNNLKSRDYKASSF